MSSSIEVSFQRVTTAPPRASLRFGRTRLQLGMTPRRVSRVERGPERSEVHDRLPRRVRDVLVGQGEHAENDQGKTDESPGFTALSSLFLIMLLWLLVPGESH